MSRLGLFSYNNYYNRIYKKETDITAYVAASVANSGAYILLDNVNFNPADGVATEIILGKGSGAFLN